jgi:TolB-like protein
MERGRLVVLPFENGSGDSAQENFAAGMTRDLMDHIAGDKDIPIVPAVAAAGYRAKMIDLQTLVHDHNVHFSHAAGS